MNRVSSWSTKLDSTSTCDRPYVANKHTAWVSLCHSVCYTHTHTHTHTLCVQEHSWCTWCVCVSTYRGPTLTSYTYDFFDLYQKTWQFDDLFLFSVPVSGDITIAFIIGLHRVEKSIPWRHVVLSLKLLVPQYYCQKPSWTYGQLENTENRRYKGTQEPQKIT